MLNKKQLKLIISNKNYFKYSPAKALSGIV